jgi:ubiquinone/menaquinone biosynthesis C-methylase UbiE
MDEKYDPRHIGRSFDEYGEREWERLHADAPARVSFYLHRRYLRSYLKRGDRVLEVGAVTGRFTIELAKLGADVIVGDVSAGQLELNREKVAEAGCEERVLSRELMDVTDLSRFSNESFDAVVCYGGPMSYVFDRADAAVGEMLRVTRSGGYVLLSVMSLAGATRRFLGEIFELYREVGMEAFQRIVQGYDQYNASAPGGHRCRMYSWRDLKALLERHPCEIVAASAANFLSVQNEELLAAVRQEDVRFWRTLLWWEARLCEQPGVLDAGTHIIAVVRRA